MIPPERAQASLAESASVVADVLTQGRLDAAVPACPGWDLADLVRHLGTVHRWATQVVVGGELPERARVDGGPEGRDALIPWFAEGAAALAAALRDVDPQRPTWTFGPPEVAAFWSRRQAQETLVHAWDARASQGQAFVIAPDMAVDGLGEIATVMFPRQVRLERTPPLEHAIAFIPTDALPDADGIVLFADGIRKPTTIDAMVRGSAADLLLLLWGRAALADGRFVVDGDPGVVPAALAAAIVP